MQELTLTQPYEFHEEHISQIKSYASFLQGAVVINGFLVLVSAQLLVAVKSDGSLKKSLHIVWLSYAAALCTVIAVAWSAALYGLLDKLKLDGEDKNPSGVSATARSPPTTWRLMWRCDKVKWACILWMIYTALGLTLTIAQAIFCLCLRGVVQFPSALALLIVVPVFLAFTAIAYWPTVVRSGDSSRRPARPDHEQGYELGDIPPISPSASSLASSSASTVTPNAHDELHDQPQHGFWGPRTSSSLPNMHPQFPSSSLSREFRPGAGPPTHAAASRGHPLMASDSDNPIHLHTGTRLRTSQRAARPKLPTRPENAGEPIEQQQRVAVCA